MIATKKQDNISIEEFEFYTQKHQGKKIIIKVSGGEFSTPEFSELINTIHLLLEIDVTIFLVFGGGAQIDEFYKTYSDIPRKKNDGVGVTTPEVLEFGVLPAYNFLIKKIKNNFHDMSYSINILEPKNLHVQSCIDCKKFGFVANPQKIELDKSKNLHIVGFVGEDSSGQKFNVNADEIASTICKTENIDQIIFITGTGGILDNSGNIVLNASKENLEEMIAGQYENVSVVGGMKKKCMEIIELLLFVPKVAMSTSRLLQTELFTHKGAGTLCTNKTIPTGFNLYTGNYNSEKYKKNNLLAITSDNDVFCTALFTKNTCCGAPITVAKKKLQQSSLMRGIVINTNISNVATGQKGIEDAYKQCELLADSMNVDSSKILVSSTGCIGPYLPMQELEIAIPKLIYSEKQDLKSAAHAIMTTDTKEKFISVQCGKATISGIAKGSGMIAPNMATMLAYVMTDAKISEEKFTQIWKKSVEKSFNMVSVDNCESTSDTAMAFMNPIFTVEETEFEKCIEQVCLFLAKNIAYDGEGATKGIEVVVSGAETEDIAKKISLKIVSSDLVKTAIFGKDLNWGRIMGAAGHTHMPIILEKLTCIVGGIPVFKNGFPTKISPETELLAFESDEIKIEFMMNDGEYSATAWGCDLTYEYVKINGEYRT